MSPMKPGEGTRKKKEEDDRDEPEVEVKVLHECRSLSSSPSSMVSPLLQFSGKVNGKSGEVMIDSGSSSNFVSSSFVARNRLVTSKLKEEQVVQLADGSEYRVNKKVKDAWVRWEGFGGKISLLVLPIIKYDLILGMTWLREIIPRLTGRPGPVG
jgi:Retroviral aspartyl protease